MLHGRIRSSGTPKHFEPKESAVQSSEFKYLVDGLPPAGLKKPLLLFLHGKGERGDDLRKVRAHGPPHLFPKFGLDRFIVLSPQCPEKEEKWNPDNLDVFLTRFCETHPVDQRRIYLTGLSLGGEGGFHLLLRWRQRFAAAVLICGRVHPKATEGLGGPMPPTWLVHSARDEVVPVTASDVVYDAFKKMGAPVKYTRYDAVGHVRTWQDAYHGTRLYDWLLEHSGAA
jgi:predicted peptidase